MKWGYLALVAILAACGGSGGGGTPTGAVEVTCGYVNNEGGYNQCTDSGIASLFDRSGPDVAYALESTTLNVDSGDVVRGGLLIHATLEVTNSTAADAGGFFSMTFDAGCAGADTWEIATFQEFTVPAGGTWINTVGGQCGDMPLGPRTLTAVAYEDVDGTPGPEIGRVVVSFNLVE